MQSIGLAVKAGRAPEEAACRLTEWLKTRNVEVHTDLTRPDLEAVIILGGDGTLLRAARLMKNKEVPILGIYLGRLGFLTEISYDPHTYAAVERLLAGDFAVEKRMMLRATVMSGSEVTWSDSALNEVVINKGALSTMIKIRVCQDEEPVMSYDGDGLIVSTPTGSTAYNLSAGGPIDHPELMLIILTPICPFMLGSRPIILPDIARLSVKVEARSPDAHLILDGQVNYELSRGKDLTIHIEREENLLRLVKSSTRSYFSVLRNKLRWGEQEGPRSTPPS